MTQELRITGGKWREKLITAPNHHPMRPTTSIDRQRLFNWVDASGLTVLDLFAGSGMLSWEALSRGARRAVLVEYSSPALRQLYATRKQLQAEKVSEIVAAKLPSRLSRVPKLDYQLIFMDPPFELGLMISTCKALEEGGYLSKNAKLYLECESSLALLNLVCVQWPHWQLLKQAKRGRVSQYLFQVSG